MLFQDFIDHFYVYLSLVRFLVRTLSFIFILTKTESGEQYIANNTEFIQNWENIFMLKAH